MTSIFYEAETVDDALVAAALETAGPGPHLHVVASDTLWVASHAVAAERVPSMRSEEFRRELMDRIDELADSVRANPKWRGALTVRGLDVLEVARYEWLEALAPPAYRAWVTDRVQRDHGGDVRIVPVTKSVASKSRFGTARREVADAIRLLKPRWVRGRSGGRHVLFVEHYPAGAKVSATVASRLGADYRFIVTDPSAFAAVESLCRAEWAVPAATRRARLASLWHAARCARVAAKAAPVDDAFREPTARAWRRAAQHIALIDDIGRRDRPRVVATSSYTGSFARAAVLGSWAPTSVYIQHGILFHYNYGTHLVHDRYLVWGPRDRAGLVARGVPADAVTVVGSPTFEHLAGRLSEAKAHDSFEVLYLPSRTGGGMVSTGAAEAMLDAVVEAVQRVDGARLTVKIHPRDRSPLFDGLADRGVRVLRDADPIETILDSDVTVSATSTVGIEACALDRPSVILAFPGVEVPDAYEEFGAVLLAHDADETADALALVAGDEAVRRRLGEARRRMIDEMFAGLEPGAAARAASVLSTLPNSG